MEKVVPSESLSSKTPSSSPSPRSRRRRSPTTLRSHLIHRRSASGSLESRGTPTTSPQARPVSLLQDWTTIRPA
ncbi:hypothetical protein QJS10_CPA09g00237 [Acorus calamus]|uniref:Uncharacterized protein n=1 Tax=Acorus calamus TaxID=4465 RepID=A0AAV9E7T3_ACOCL|nr:hypothetical protein QJS10_CPA09g00237 [Acorus calamus]